METLLRTILVLVAAFAAGYILPPDSILGGFTVSAFLIASILDLFLLLWSGRGLISHIKNDLTQ